MPATYPSPRPSIFLKRSLRSCMAPLGDLTTSRPPGLSCRAHCLIACIGSYMCSRTSSMATASKLASAKRGSEITPHFTSAMSSSLRQNSGNSALISSPLTCHPASRASARKVPIPQPRFQHLSGICRTQQRQNVAIGTLGSFVPPEKIFLAETVSAARAFFVETVDVAFGKVSLNIYERAVGAGHHADLALGVGRRAGGIGTGKLLLHQRRARASTKRTGH